MAAKTDKAISGLLYHLKARGLSDVTLLIGGIEFGRSPLVDGRNGRDHHPCAFSTWFRGAGVKGGRVPGSTGEFGLRPVGNPLVSRDINATILRLLGLDHLKLTCFCQGRDRRLTDLHGELD